MITFGPVKCVRSLKFILLIQKNDPEDNNPFPFVSSTLSAMFDCGSKRSLVENAATGTL